MAKATPVVGVCAGCKTPLGIAAKVLPFTIDDGEKLEAFCPICFVYERALKEPERFHTGSFVPLKCVSCGVSAVSIGSDSCSQCGSRSTQLLRPAPKS